MDDQDFLEQIDACRTDSNDLHDESFADVAKDLTFNPIRRALFDAVQRADRAVVDAMEDVPLPVGLEQRLLAALSDAHHHSADATVLRGDPVAAVESSVESTSGNVPVTTAAAERVSRRRMIWTSLSAATAASVATAAWIGSRHWRQTQLTPGFVLSESITFHTREVPQPLQTSAPPRGMSRAIARGVRTTGWRRVDGFLGRPELDGIAFELMHFGTQATLYIVEAEVPSLKSWPLRQPDNTTAGRSVSAWQSQKLLYVLVVDGGPRAYSGFVVESGVV